MARSLAFQSQRRLRRGRGFTLVELMVAMTGGLFLSIVVFAVSRDASRFYQREIRVANATITGVSGFERLVSDLARAGHMSTPNIELDPRICGRPDENWPEALGRLRAVAIETGVTTGLDSKSEALAAGTPDALVISGALEVTEELYSNTIEPIVGAAGFTISLNLLTPSAKRLGLTTGLGSSDVNGEILQSVFMKDNVGRIVRVRKDGLEQYAVVSSVTATDTVAAVMVSDKPGLMFRKGGANDIKCGINDEGGGYAISVVSIVRYGLRSMMNNADYKYLFDASGRDQVPFEDTRAELTRVELDAFGVDIPGTLEIVAEYAVDLKLRPWAAGSAANLPSLAAADAYGPASTQSQALRGMNVLLSVRSREAAGARLRTLQSDIALRNLENANW
jgi:hypothetical protein